MEKSKRPTSGKGQTLLIDVGACQKAASQLDAVASIRRGLAQARKGVGRPADEVFDELERGDTSR